MTQLAVTIQSDFREADAIADRLSKAAPVMRVVGEIVRGEALKNFRQGGVFPAVWEKSERVKKRGGQTLVKTAVLRNSLSVLFENDSATVGTSVPYAGIHQFGGVIIQNVAARTNIHGMNGRFLKRSKVNLDDFGRNDLRGGGKRGVRFFTSQSRAYTRTIHMPARPFLPVDDQGNLSPDVARRLGNTLALFFMKGVA